MLKVTNICKSFNSNTNNQINIFNNFNLEVEINTSTAIIGPNGCGKTTLFNIISGNILADQGNIFLKEKNISKLKEERAKYIGRVYQNPSMGISSSLTILENLSLANKKGEKFTLKKLLKKENIDKYIELLKDLSLGLEKKLDTKVKFLSGGQRQALSLIMATMKYPDLLLLDEHTAALDPKTSNLIMEKTKKLIEKYSITTIMISHNIKDALKYSDRIIMLNGGQIVLDKPSADIDEKELIQIYIRKFEQIVA